MKETIINPYKKFGQLHNEGLDFVIKQVSSKNSSVSAEQLSDAVTDYISKITNQTSKAEKAIVYSYISQAIATNKNFDFHEKINILDLSYLALEFLKELNAIETNDPDEIVDQIDKLEVKISESKLSNRDITHLYLFTAISKHSVEYWKAQLNKSTSKWKTAFGKIKSLPWKEDLNGAIDACVEPGIDICFNEPLKIPIVVTKVVGKAIVCSIVGYFTKAKKLQTEEIVNASITTSTTIKLPNRNKK